MPDAFATVIASALARSTFGTLALSAAYAVLSFATVVILARLLGVSDFGAYAYSIAWANLLGVPAVLGFDRLIVRDVATYVAEKNWSLTRGLLRRSSQIVGSVSICLALSASAVAVIVLRTPGGGTFPIAMVLVPLTSLTLSGRPRFRGSIDP